MSQKIIEFVCSEQSIDIEALRKGFFVQMDRAEKRLKGLEMFLSLVQNNSLMPSVRLAIIHAWLGLLPFLPKRK